MLKKGVLLVNIGSPDEPKTPEVRRYLQQFLFDARVIDIAALPRWLLVYGLISPFRAPKSAHAYQQIWGPGGSPLLVKGKELVDEVQKLLGPTYMVRLGMRYQNPSLPAVIDEFIKAGIDELRLLPLYPQYAQASTASSVAEVMRLLSGYPCFPPLKVLPDFYEDPRFIGAFEAVARPHLSTFQQDYLLFSYHGLPESQMRKTRPEGHSCEAERCSERIGDGNRFCYKAQCYATTRALVQALGLQEGRYSTSFQSRLNEKWIRPFTDVVLPELHKQGFKRLAVMCPAFVTDCLETLEEIGMRAAEDWKKLGGEAFLMVPSLNSEAPWCRAVADMLR